MGKTLTIAPVTRLEGHAKITIELDDSGNVKDAMFQTVELRGFEKFAIGRPAEEMPRIVTSICGVCPWSHHLASAKTCDAVFGATPPPAAVKLRDLCDSIAFTEEHILHFYFLAGPDFVMGPDAEYAKRNVIGIAAAEPEIGKKVVRNRHLGAQMLNIVSGKAIHPVTAVPGGFSKPLLESERDRCLPMAEEILEFAKWGMAWCKENIFPKYMDAIKSIGIIETGFMGTVKDDGTFDCYDGKLRLMKPDGSYEDFEDKDYLDVIEEKVLPFSYMKFPYAKKWGEGFELDPKAPKGIYRTNTLARLNVVDKMPTPLAQAELEEFREAFGRPAQPSLLYNYARLIELLCHAEHMVDLLKDPEITSRETRVDVTPRAARGVGHTEAPRGTLIHDYETDDKGLITNCNLIVGTTHNNAAINMSVKQTATDLIKDGKYDEAILNKVEMAVRAYDPCLSCATHNLDGTIAVEVEIRDADGNVVKTMKN
jgi:F420-non-reducing hydrogenase large subunit